MIAPGAFRLWGDGGGVLSAIADEQGWRTVDPDDVGQASPVAAARSAADCEAVVLIDCARGDLPGDLSTETRVVTWLIGEAIPPFISQGVHDRLLVVDAQRRAAAITAGWPADQVILAGWPLGWERQVCSLARGVCDDDKTTGNGVPLPMPPEQAPLQSSLIRSRSAARL